MPHNEGLSPKLLEAWKFLWASVNPDPKEASVEIVGATTLLRKQFGDAAVHRYTELKKKGKIEVVANDIRGTKRVRVLRPPDPVGGSTAPKRAAKKARRRTSRRRKYRRRVNATVESGTMTIGAHLAHLQDAYDLYRRGVELFRKEGVEVEVANHRVTLVPNVRTKSKK